MPLQVILQGMGTGLVLSIYVGATFFAVVETSLRRGPIAAVLLNTGVWVSDLLCILAAYYGANELMQPISHNIVVKIIAGVALLAFGISYFLRKPDETVKPLAGRGVLILLGKGFAINTLNPGVWLFWFGAMVVAVSNFEFTGLQIVYYFSSTLFTMIVFDLVKILFATRLRKMVTEKLMTRLFRVTGVILMIFGLFVIVRIFRF
ncbi:MAG: LysE family transporter [Bacteroidales bacterium]|nr:LysE family transporter [Bacteroidales bacterium]